MQKAEEEIRVLREELMCKIQENEELHMRFYEEKNAYETEVANIKRYHEEEVKSLREAHKQELKICKDSQDTLVNDVQQRASEHEAERAQTSRLREQIRDLTDKKSQLEISLKTAHAAELSL